MLKYSKQIDGLRFIAILLVLLDHFAEKVFVKFETGYLGVDMFFVISGFLITYILIGTKENFGTAYKNFMARRVLRIFPLYYTVIIFFFVLGNEDLRQNFVYFITYSYNYFRVINKLPTNCFSHCWSLCIEEQFYLIWPIIALVFRKKLIILKCFLIILIALSFLQIGFVIFPSVGPFNFMGLFPRAGSLGLGCFGAILLFENKLSPNILSNIYIEILAILVLLLNPFIPGFIKYSIFPIASLVLVIKAYTNNFSLIFISKFLSNKTIIYLGTISYGIYLFHYPIGSYFSTYILTPLLWNKINSNSNYLLVSLKNNDWILNFPLYSLVTFLIAHFSFKYFEKPILKLKDKFFKYN